MASEKEIKPEKQIFTDINLQAGEILQMELAAGNINKAEFAESLGMKPRHLANSYKLKDMQMQPPHLSFKSY